MRASELKRGVFCTAPAFETPTLTVWWTTDNLPPCPALEELSFAVQFSNPTYNPYLPERIRAHTAYGWWLLCVWLKANEVESVDFQALAAKVRVRYCPTTFLWRALVLTCRLGLSVPAASTTTLPGQPCVLTQGRSRGSRSRGSAQLATAERRSGRLRKCASLTQWSLGTARCLPIYRLSFTSCFRTSLDCRSATRSRLEAHRVQIRPRSLGRALQVCTTSSAPRFATSLITTMRTLQELEIHEFRTWTRLCRHPSTSAASSNKAVAESTVR